MPTRDEAKALLGTLLTDNLVGLRDRALLSMLLYVFARVGDYYPVGKRFREWI